MINTSKADLNMYNEVINRADPALKIYNELKREADEARKAMELAHSYLIKVMRVTKDMNEGMWSPHVSWKERSFVESLSTRFGMLERRLIREGVITKCKRGYK